MFSPQVVSHTIPFKGIIKLQIIKFRRHSSNKQNFNDACSVLFSVLKPRGYSTGFRRPIKSETVREGENSLIFTAPYRPYKTQHNLPPQISTGSSTRCRLHSIMKTQSNVNFHPVNVAYLIICNL